MRVSGRIALAEESGHSRFRHSRFREIPSSGSSPARVANPTRSRQACKASPQCVAVLLVLGEFRATSLAFASDPCWVAPPYVRPIASGAALTPIIPAGRALVLGAFGSGRHAGRREDRRSHGPRVRHVVLGSSHGRCAFGGLGRPQCIRPFARRWIGRTPFDTEGCCHHPARAGELTSPLQYKLPVPRHLPTIDAT